MGYLSLDSLLTTTLLVQLDDPELAMETARVIQSASQLDTGVVDYVTRHTNTQQQVS